MEHFEVVKKGQAYEIVVNPPRVLTNDELNELTKLVYSLMIEVK